MNNLHLSGQDVLEDILEEVFDGALIMLCCVGPYQDKIVRENAGRSACGESQASEERSDLISKQKTASKIVIEAKLTASTEGKGFLVVLQPIPSSRRSVEPR